ncbi:MAG TPA: hypothetical protein VL137_11135, partial [Polyangiaceae bacterium]|nr:hypothetical protein [Polyangiaceae bacterium]
MIRQGSLFALLCLLSVGALSSACGSNSPKGSAAAGTSGAPGQVTSQGGNAGESTSVASSGTAGTNPAGTIGATGGSPSGVGGLTGAVAGSGGDATAQGGVGADAGPIDDGSMVQDSPTAYAWNSRTGILNVDYGSYLSKQDVVYSQPNNNPLYGLTVGNGRVGAMVWSENGLTLQVGGVDLAEQSTFGAGLVNFQTTPALSEASFEQRLQLYNGELITHYGAGSVVTIMGAPNSETLGIHVEDPRTDVTSITLELSLWDVSTLSNTAAAPDLDTWKTVTSFAEPTAAGLSRGQTDAKHFGYTLAATVEGAPFTTQSIANDRVRLTITPSPSYTIWFTASSRLNAPNNDSVAAAHSALTDASTSGYPGVLQQYQDFWHDFWGKSFVQFSDPSGDTDYAENFYYLSTYVIAAGGFGNYPFHFINGVFRATHDDTKWSNAYWYWNQRDVYHSFLASNHADLVSVFNNLYSRNADRLRTDTQTRYGAQGIWVPETMGFDGNADGTVGSDYTKGILSTGTEAALNMYDQYRYTGDEAYLATTAYPFMRDVASFYVSRFTHDAGSDTYFMGNSNSHETYWQVKNAITDLASVRRLFPIVIAVSQKLGLDEATRPQWQALLDKVVPYPSDGSVYLPHEPP